MTYTITPYTLKKAKQLNVHIEPSKDKKHKIDVFDMDNKYITSVGAIGYLDYPSFKILYGSEYAKKKRLQYKERHEKDRHKLHSRGYYADQLLW